MSNLLARCREWVAKNNCRTIDERHRAEELRSFVEQEFAAQVAAAKLEEAKYWYEWFVRPSAQSPAMKRVAELQAKAEE